MGIANNNDNVSACSHRESLCQGCQVEDYVSCRHHGRIPDGEAYAEYWFIMSFFVALYCKQVMFSLVAGLRRKTEIL